jgi:hypothetical protein
MFPRRRMLKSFGEHAFPRQRFTKHIGCPELIHGFGDNAFVKHNSGTLGDGVLYAGRLAEIRDQRVNQLVKE